MSNTMDFLRNEGSGRVYKKSVNINNLGAILGIDIKLETNYKYISLGALYYDGIPLDRQAPYIMMESH